MKAIVTGGAGLIGSAIINRLNELGCTDILVVDFLNGKNWGNLTPLQFKDYAEADKFKSKWIKYFDVVFHLGACSDTTETNCKYLIENNFEYTKKLAKKSIELNKKFIYASSAATYGDGSNGMSDTASLDGLMPLNMYGYSKHLFDLFAAKNDLFNRITGLKYFNVFGPNEAHKGKMSSVVFKAFHQIKEKGFVELFKSYNPDYADGEQKRDFLYVKDAADITIKFSQSTASGLYNVGSGCASSWMELVGHIFKSLNIEPSVRFIEMPEELQAKYQYFTEANIRNLLNTLNNVKLTPLEVAVDDYVNNYLQASKKLGE